MEGGVLVALDGWDVIYTIDGYAWNFLTVAIDKHPSQAQGRVIH